MLIVLSRIEMEQHWAFSSTRSFIQINLRREFGGITHVSSQTAASRTAVHRQLCALESILWITSLRFTYHRVLTAPIICGPLVRNKLHVTFLVSRVLKWPLDFLKTWALLIIQGLSKRFERFKFGIFYVLIVKIRYNFTHK